MRCFVLVIFSCAFMCIARTTENDNEALPKIAIVGAGVGGTSAAYYLRQLFGEKATIDVYEAGKVGGRAAVISISGQDYEAGGSVIHKKNKYMTEFVHKFNKTVRQTSSSDSFFGLYSDSGIIFQTSNWQLITLSKLLWRYGFCVYTCREWTKNLISNKFARIYEFQDRGIAFTTVEDMLRAMSEDVLNMTHYNLREVLYTVGIKEKFIQELAVAAMRANYGQTTDVHGFVGAVSLAGAEPGLWSVQGGNWQIAMSLLKESKASLIEATVNSISLVKDELGTGSISYEIEYIKTHSADKEVKAREYDIVIMAAPIFGSKNRVSFVDFPNPVTPFSQEFHTTVAMFVEGRINASTFNLNEHSQFPPDLLTVTSDLFFSSIGKLSPVDSSTEPENGSGNDNAVWKTFLNKVPTEEQIGSLFENYTDLRLVNWLAYPEYKPNMDLPPFMLYEKLYYINAVESAASALEMSVIGSRNVALLAYNQWQGYFDKIDEISQAASSEQDRSEL